MRRVRPCPPPYGACTVRRLFAKPQTPNPNPGGPKPRMPVCPTQRRAVLHARRPPPAAGKHAAPCALPTSGRAGALSAAADDQGACSAGGRGRPTASAATRASAPMPVPNAMDRPWATGHGPRAGGHAMLRHKAPLGTRATVLDDACPAHRVPLRGSRSVDQTPCMRGTVTEDCNLGSTCRTVHVPMAHRDRQPFNHRASSLVPPRCAAWSPSQPVGVSWFRPGMTSAPANSHDPPNGFDEPCRNGLFPHGEALCKGCRGVLGRARSLRATRLVQDVYFEPCMQAHAKSEIQKLKRATACPPPSLHYN